MTPTEDLREVIQKLHGGTATHVKSVPVKESFRGQTVWDGIVEVFDLEGHATTSRVYAWSHATDDPKQPQRHVTVLHIGPITSALAAVRAVIIEEFRANAPTEA